MTMEMVSNAAGWKLDKVELCMWVVCGGPQPIMVLQHTRSGQGGDAIIQRLAEMAVKQSKLLQAIDPGAVLDGVCRLMFLLGSSCVTSSCPSVCSADCVCVVRLVSVDGVRQQKMGAEEQHNMLQ
jgi:hypothetical protein